MNRYRRRLPIYTYLWLVIALAALLVWVFDHR